MTTIMSARPISVFDRNDPEIRAALAAGWARRDLWWERLQEQANEALQEGQEKLAVRLFMRAHWISYFGFARGDPRQATGLANAAFAARLSGSQGRAERNYKAAVKIWSRAPAGLQTLTIQPRAKSSLFHLRMELKHWDTYRDNTKTRLARFIEETGECLEALSADAPPPHRLFSRWRGEKPAVFDDTRKILAACLLVVSRT